MQDVEDPDTPKMLHTFEEARAAGELDDEEMERVRQRLARSGMPAPKKSSAQADDDAVPKPP